MKKAPIITIEHRNYAAPSVTAAAQLLNLLSKLKPMERKHSDDYRKSWFEEDEEKTLQVELKLDQEVRLKPKRLGLPTPARRSKRCRCGHSDVAPGDECPSCGRGHFDS